MLFFIEHLVQLSAKTKAKKKDNIAIEYMCGNSGSTKKYSLAVFAMLNK